MTLAASRSAGSRRKRGLLERLSGTPDLRAALVVAIVVFGVSIGLRIVHDEYELRQHLGGEYYNIGRALVDGRGFSDPFRERTGPTAWMPPIYPLLLATLIAVLKTRALVGEAVVVLTNVALVAIGTTIYSVARRAGRRISPWLAVVFYLVWVVAFDYWFFELTHDVWLIALAANFVALATYQYFVTLELSPWFWGLLGGLVALVSPALGLGWGCLSAVGVVRGGDRRRWIHGIAIATIVVSPWIVRNAITFHQFIPVKSNLFFDLYQSNYVDEDGIYDLPSMSQHPLGSLSMRFRYTALGESGYNAEFRTAFLSAIARDPMTFLKKIRNRAVACTLHYLPIDAEAPLGLAMRRVIWPLPWVAWAGSIWIRGPNRRLLLTLGLLSGAYLTPYIVAAFYARYLLPLTPVLVLMCFLSIDQVAWRLTKGRGSHSRERGGAVAPAR